MASQVMHINKIGSEWLTDNGRIVSNTQYAALCIAKDSASFLDAGEEITVANPANAYIHIYLYRHYDGDVYAGYALDGNKAERRYRDAWLSSTS